MKLLFILIIISFSINSFACRNKAPISAVQEYISSPVPVAGVDCSERPDEECVCFDGVESWQVAELADEIINGDPIYSAKENVTACATEEECKALGESLCQNKDEFFYAENLILSGFEAYCSKIVGYEQVKTGKKVLKDSPAKKAAYLAKIEDEKLAIKASEDKKKAALERFRAFKPKGTTILQLRNEFEAFADDLKEVVK